MYGLLNLPNLSGHANVVDYAETVTISHSCPSKQHVVLGQQVTINGIDC